MKKRTIYIYGSEKTIEIYKKALESEAVRLKLKIKNDKFKR